MSNLLRSAVKASAAKVKGGKAIDAKHHGTHQIAAQAIVVRENEGRANNHRPFYLALRGISKRCFAFGGLLMRLNTHSRLKDMIRTRDSYAN